MKTTYLGSCHCKMLKYEAKVDLEVGTGRCNCTYCSSSRNWTARLAPDDFKWISGEKEASTYSFRANSLNKHYFCKKCGVAICTIGDIPETIGPYVSVRVPTLWDVKPELLARLPIRYMDGLHDNWFQEPEIKSYL